VINKSLRRDAFLRYFANRTHHWVCALTQMSHQVKLQQGRFADIENKLKAWFKKDKACQAIDEIPGVGLLTATATVATMGVPRHFVTKG